MTGEEVEDGGRLVDESQEDRKSGAFCFETERLPLGVWRRHVTKRNGDDRGGLWRPFLFRLPVQLLGNTFSGFITRAHYHLRLCNLSRGIYYCSLLIFGKPEQKYWAAETPSFLA